MKPIEMLIEELKILKRCKEKSILSFKNKSITLELHETHLSNLNPLIDEFQESIKKLQIVIGTIKLKKKI